MTKTQEEEPIADIDIEFASLLSSSDVDIQAGDFLSITIWPIRFVG